MHNLKIFLIYWLPIAIIIGLILGPILNRIGKHYPPVPKS